MQLLVGVDREPCLSRHLFIPFRRQPLPSLWSYLLPEWLLSGNQAVQDGQVSNVTTQMAVPRTEVKDGNAKP